MFGWIGDHWFQLLVFGGFVAVVLSLFKIADMMVSAIHDWSQLIVHTLGEIRNDLGEIERALKVEETHWPSGITKVTLEQLINRLAFEATSREIDERDRETRDKRES